MASAISVNLVVNANESNDNSIVTSVPTEEVTETSSETVSITEPTTISTTQPTATKPTVVKPTKVAISGGNRTIQKGKTVTLKATVTPTNATTTLKWYSSNTKVATVNQNGKVTGKSTGTVKITVKTDNGKSASIKIRVIQKPTKVAIKGNTVLFKRRTLTLKATVTPKNATTTLKWYSSNTKIATVNQNGKVTGKSTGTVTITVKTDNGKSASIKIRVIQRVTSIKLNKTVLHFAKVGKTKKLTATVSPKDSSNKSVKWKSSNTKIATVTQNGKVKSKGKGHCTVTATTKDGSKKSAKCTVVVGKQVSKVTLNKSKATVLINNTVKIKATVTKKKAVYKTLKWTSSNTKVATVNKNGKVTGIAKGTATIKASALDGSNKSATCKVTVKVIDDNTILTHKQLCTKTNINKLCNKLNNWFKSQGARIDKTLGTDGEWGQWYYVDSVGSAGGSINTEFYSILEFLALSMSGDTLGSDDTWTVLINGKKTVFQVDDFYDEKQWQPYWDWCESFEYCKNCKYVNNNIKYRKTKYCSNCINRITDGKQNGWKYFIDECIKYPFTVNVYPKEYTENGQKKYNIYFYYGYYDAENDIVT
jgi:uncharacterized protein YjdB